MLHNLVPETVVLQQHNRKRRLLSIFAFFAVLCLALFISPCAGYVTGNIIGDLNSYAGQVCPPYANYVWVDTDGIDNGGTYGVYDTIVIFQTITGEATPSSFGYFFTADKTNCGGGVLDRGRMVIHFVDMLAPGFVESDTSTWSYTSVPCVQLSASHDETVASGNPYETSYMMVQAYQEISQSGPITGIIGPDPGIGAPRDFEFADPAGIKELFVSTDYAENLIHSFRILTSEPLNTVTVTSPNGGESWLKGFTHTLEWSYTGTVGTMFKIELLKAGVVDSLIADVMNTGAPDQTYVWTIPASQASGSDYSVRITGSDPLEYSDTSNAEFTISDTATVSILINSPAGGVEWQMDHLHPITWSPSGDVGATFTIELLKAGVVDRLIAEVANTGALDQSYEWMIPVTLPEGTDYQIRITGSGPDTYAETSALFSVVKPTSSNIPEFPFSFIPVAMIISLAGVVILLNRSGKKNS